MRLRRLGQTRPIRRAARFFDGRDCGEEDHAELEMVQAVSSMVGGYSLGRNRDIRLDAPPLSAGAGGLVATNRTLRVAGVKLVPAEMLERGWGGPGLPGGKRRGLELRAISSTG